MEHIGDRLKKIRLEKGLSLEEVHKRTKIHINVLRAIEDDSFVNLNPVYVKGFLKIYCQFLGENPADYISDYREPRQRVLVTGEQPAQVRQLRQPVSPPGHQSAAGVSGSRRFTLPRIPLPSPRLLRILAAGLLALAALVLVVRLVSAGVRAWKASAQKRPAAAAVAAKKSAARPAARSAAEPAAAPNAVTPSVAVKAPSSDASLVRLGIRAKEDCWLQVRVDGKTVFQSVLNRGRLEGWQASSRIELTLGDAGKVDVEVNGSRIPALGRKGQPVKNILITRDGLKVGK